MFTGIVAAVGRIVKVQALNTWAESGRHEQALNTCMEMAEIGEQAFNTCVETTRTGEQAFNTCVETTRTGAQTFNTCIETTDVGEPLYPFAETTSMSGEAVSSCADTAGLRLRIHAGALDLSDVKPGDSIAVQGACMTIVALQNPYFEIDVSQESLNCTVGLDREGDVNLEKSLCLGDALGGHWVSGHIDGIGEIIQVFSAGESRHCVVQVPKEMARYMAYKGSLALNGISLTINDVKDNAHGCEVHLNIIPHTQYNTTLHHMQIGHKVNLEIDLIARYIERMMHFADV